MKKALLIATTLMALALPAHATQFNQVDDGDDQQDQQGEKIELTTNLICRYVRNRPVCF